MARYELIPSRKFHLKIKILVLDPAFCVIFYSMSAFKYKRISFNTYYKCPFTLTEFLHNVLFISLRNFSTRSLLSRKNK
jgi:hypothetical protein